MPVFRLIDDLIFPSPELAEPDGLLAIGGDLSAERLVMAYASGIFPWYSHGEPILWWSPAPRLVLFPDEFHLPKRLQRTIRQNKFTVTADSAFEQVIHCCAMNENRRDSGTWITEEMQNAYVKLHELGFAHSIECWQDDTLAGGLYGVCLDQVFFGESMFTSITDSSKIALHSLVSNCDRLDIKLIDCQMTTDHLLRFGAREINRNTFMEKLEVHITRCRPQKKWRL